MTLKELVRSIKRGECCHAGMCVDCSLLQSNRGCFLDINDDGHEWLLKHIHRIMVQEYVRSSSNEFHNYGVLRCIDIIEMWDLNRDENPDTILRKITKILEACVDHTDEDHSSASDDSEYHKETRKPCAVPAERSIILNR